MFFTGKCVKSGAARTVLLLLAQEIEFSRGRFEGLLPADVEKLSLVVVASRRRCWIIARYVTTTRSSDSQSSSPMTCYRFRARATGRSASLIRPGSNWRRLWCYGPAIAVHLTSDLLPLVVKHTSRLSGLGSLLEPRSQPSKSVSIRTVLVRSWPRRRSLSQAQSPPNPASALLRACQPLCLYIRSNDRSL
jgi:hypothetical protein